MHEAATNGTIVTVTAVIGVVLFLIMLVIVIDHKARIQGEVVNDVFSIIGKRGSHPIWSYFIGMILLLIIFGVAIELGFAMLKILPIENNEQPSRLLVSLQKKSILETARHFHNPANHMALEGKKSVCFYCHGDFPHFQRRMIRTLLNMHTQFLGCMTCHVDKEKIDERLITMKWLNFSGVEVKGQHFGLENDPETGYLFETDDLYSKIVPYLTGPGSEKLLEITEDDPMAIDFVLIRDKLKGRDRESVKKSLHNMVMPKGRFCSTCHIDRSKSYIPFEKLGFTEERISDLTNLNIIGLVEKYKEFYMPDMMYRNVQPIEFDTSSSTEEAQRMNSTTGSEKNRADKVK
jgi:hypothetical protein